MHECISPEAIAIAIYICIDIANYVDLALADQIFQVK